MEKIVELRCRNIVAALLCVSLIAVCGCGGNPRVHGTITFENGEPLKSGLLVYESQKGAFYGDVQSNGTYSMGTTKNGQGIPLGEYSIYFQTAHAETGRDEDNRPHYSPLLADKFYAPDTSGLTCTVKGRTRFDFQVTAPGR